MERIERLLVLQTLLLLIWYLYSVKPIRKRIYKVFLAVKRFLNRMVHGIVYYTLCLVPRDKSLIVFTAGEGMSYADNSKYLFLKFTSRPEFRCVWLTKKQEIYKKLKEKGYEVYLLSSRMGRWMQLHAGTLIHTNSLKEEFNYLLTGGAVSVNCWHGVGLKRVWYRNMNAFSGRWIAKKPSLRRSYNLWWAGLNSAKENFVISTSEEVSAYYPATYNIPADHVLNLGQARNDVFYDGSLEEGELPDVFRTGKTILYLPTYRNYNVRKGKGETVGDEIDYAKLSNVLKKYGYTFVIKQHRFNTRASTLSRKYKNIVDISSQNDSLDTQLLLKYTDILITDYSSCYTDFLLLDRPVMFYCYDLDTYQRKWQLNFDYDYVTPGPKAFDSDELIEEMEKLLQGQDEYEAERQRVKRVFYSPENQGPVAEKQVDYIIKNIIKR